MYVHICKLQFTYIYICNQLNIMKQLYNESMKYLIQWLSNNTHTHRYIYIWIICICIPKLLWLLSLLCSIFVLALKVPFSPFVDLRELFEMLRLVLGLDFLSPLTFRSGTTIPGDVVIGGFYGLMMLGFLKFWPWCLAHQSAATRRRFYLLCRKKDDYKSDSPFKVGIQSCVCLRPENRPSVFAFSWFVICWGRGGGEG